MLRVFIDTASSAEIQKKDIKTDVENIAIPNAPIKEASGTKAGSFNGYFSTHKKIAHDSRRGKAATSVLRINNDCAAGG
jgi:hypothetical protein